ncbi:hypothetical protein BSNK01_13330 [Bacillaceae bacterium]
MLERKESVEIPPVDIPDEIRHTNRPEIGETTIHPGSPDPQVRNVTERATNATGFRS